MDDSVEVVVGFVTECGALLQDITPKGLYGIFDEFRAILNDGKIDKRVQFLIEGLFAVRKENFQVMPILPHLLCFPVWYHNILIAKIHVKGEIPDSLKCLQGHPAVRPELDLVEIKVDQNTHEVSLKDVVDPETSLGNVFCSFFLSYCTIMNEKRYEDLKREILGDESSGDKEGSEATSGDEEEDSEEEDEDEEAMKIRRTIYLTIMSSVDFEEAAHKLLKIKLEPGQEVSDRCTFCCIRLLSICIRQAVLHSQFCVCLLGQRFCMINKIHQENFEKCFVQQYSMIHRLETNKLHALPWHVLAYIRLTEEDTTSSSRIFVKILFQVCISILMMHHSLVNSILMK
ncbi:hypothetical protein MKW94_008587 [Papaver nudicaule]|uniref:MI domain-containing protein n=1 Tax=Papaver nudicaule TaxID=74823 RepID=A0AA41UYE7_PAPNU|nr:hypothetical protein [Papaver nudicaule]